MLILGHRGAHGKNFAENSLPSFVAAIEKGADGIELDLRASRDGEIVILHDADLRRIAGDARVVSELTAQELLATPLRHPGAILTLNDVTAAIHEPSLLDLEIKHRSVLEPLISKLLTSAGLRERSIISSFHVRNIGQVRKACPDVRTLVLVPRWPLPFRRARLWRQLQSVDAWGVGFPLTVLTKRRIEFLRTLGFMVAGWDMRGTKAEARRAVRLGLDVGIVKDVAAAVAFRK